MFAHFVIEYQKPTCYTEDGTTRHFQKVEERNLMISIAAL